MRIVRVIAATVSGAALVAGVACGTDKFGTTADADAITDAATGAVDAPNGDARLDAASSDAGCTSFEAPADSGCTINGACLTQTLATVTSPDGGDRYPFGIAVDSASVFWASQSDYNGHGKGQIHRVPKSPGGPVDTIARGEDAPSGIALDSTYVYWVNNGTNAGGTDSVRRLPKDAPRCAPSGCTPPEVVFGSVNGTIDTIIAPADGVLFVKGGLVAYPFFRLEYDPVSKGWQQTRMFSNADYSGFTADDAHVFVGSGTNAAIDTITLDGTLRQPFAKFPDKDAGFGGAQLKVDCVSLFSFGSNGDVARFPKLAPSASVLANVPGQIYATAVDGTFLYAGLANGGGLQRLRKDGTGKVLAIATGSPWSLTIDDKAVYVGDHDTGSILKITK